MLAIKLDTALSLFAGVVVAGRLVVAVVDISCVAFVTAVVVVVVVVVSALTFVVPLARRWSLVLRSCEVRIDCDCCDCDGCDCSCCCCFGCVC